MKSVRDVRSTKDDETFRSLLNEMDAERERRWKSEQATKKLLENIKILQVHNIQGGIWGVVSIYSSELLQIFLINFCSCIDDRRTQLLNKVLVVSFSG